MPLIYSSTQRETSNSRMLDIREALSNSLIARESRYHSLTPFLQRYNIESSNSSSSSSSSDDSNRSDTSDDVDDDQEEEEEEEDGEEDEDDTTTVTESFTRSRVDMYRLAIRSNSEILEDLAAIIRILRQINTIYRVFNNNNSSRYLDARRRRRMMRRRRIPTLLHHSLSDDDVSDHDAEEDDVLEEEEEEEEDEEANKLLEAGLEDLQAVLTMENTNSGGVKRQSTLALLALITYQQNHCSDEYLQHYLDPNGEYCRELSIFAAATYDEEEEIINQPPKSCKDIIFAAEEIYGSNWLDEFHQGKEGALRKMLDKLTFVAQIRSKIRSSENLTAIR